MNQPNGLRETNPLLPKLYETAARRHNVNSNQVTATHEQQVNEYSALFPEVETKRKTARNFHMET